MNDMKLRRSIIVVPLAMAQDPRTRLQIEQKVDAEEECVDTSVLGGVKVGGASSHVP